MFIDEIHTVMKVGNDGSSVPLVEMLKPILTDRKLSIIGATTDKEFSKYFETNAAFARRFQRVHVSEPTVNETIEILRYSKDMYERHHGINIQDSALVAAVKLSDRFVKDRYFPDKALDVIDEAMSRQALSMSAACGFGGSAGNRKRPLSEDVCGKR
ncbi:hypothetical protein FBU59_005130 [Linderina macrospora]|uniref:Uncharacterized protein n=1 Tax=Linderina macrospora TaxID=4868 RepID=A0ACC1J3R2_9FUNG|nr:hypothetical protein FBU59_005130 [Linderina macrospora]